MGLKQNQQIFELIKNSQKILLIFKKNYSGDALSSALAIFLLLKKLEKKVDLVCQDFDTTSNYSFLPQIDQIQSEISCLKQVIVSLDVKNSAIYEISISYQNLVFIPVHFSKFDYALRF